MVDQPVEKSSLRIISDLIPTQAITETWPAADTLYGELPYANRTSPLRFASHRFYKLAEREGDFTRAIFIPGPGAFDPATPFNTIWTYDSSIYWPQIVLGIDFYADTATLTGGVPGYYHGNPDTVWTVIIKRRPAYKGLTKLRIRQYLSVSNPFDFSASLQTSFTPTNISWALIGSNGRGETGEALHPEVPVPGCDQGLSQAFIWDATDPDGRVTSVGERTGRIFKETGGLEANVFIQSSSVTHPYLWLDQIVDDKVTALANGLFLREIVDAYRPEPENDVEEYQT